MTSAPRASRRRRFFAWFGAAVATLIVIAVAAMLIWANTGRMEAEPAPLAAVRADPAVTLTDASGAFVLAPTGATNGTGVVFFPGAKVDPLAYAATFRDLASAGTTVVIADVPLRLAILETRSIDTFAELAPDVDAWAIGGHSLGGVRACQYADDEVALVLLGSYCAADLSETSTRVLSIAGSHDGLSTPEKIAAARPLLPASALLITLDGANHANFGAYGPQPGDGTSTVTEQDAASDISAAILAFLTP